MTVAAAVAIAVAVVTEMFTKVIPAKRMIERILNCGVNGQTVRLSKDSIYLFSVVAVSYIIYRQK